MEVASNLQAKFLRLMKQLDKEVRKLTETVADNPNTKRVIKETSLVIRSLMSQATTTEIWTMMKTRDLQRGKEPEMEAMTGMKEVGCQVDMTIRIENKEIGIQTEEAMTMEGKVRGINEAQISETKTYEDFTRIRNLDWPEAVYAVKWQ